MENSQQQARWYVLHTYSGYESMVMENLHKLIENNSVRRGKRVKVVRGRCTYYVFVKLVYSNELWYLLTNTRASTGFRGPSGRPFPHRGRGQEDAPPKVAVPMNFIVGDNVRVLSEPP